MMRPPSQGKASPYESLGLTAPRRNFLSSASAHRASSAAHHRSAHSTRPGTAQGGDSTTSAAGGGGGGGGGGGASHSHHHHGNNSANTNNNNIINNNHHHPSSFVAQSDNEIISTALETKGVILAEHKVELHDMLEESVALLRNIYRSKHVLGDNLKYADPCYTTDFVGQFNLATPPVFDPAFASTTGQQQPQQQQHGKQQFGSFTASHGDVGSSAAAGDDNSSNHHHHHHLSHTSSSGVSGMQQGNNTTNAEVVAELQNMREKLRTAEELVKKLYRRNTQLETENQFVKAELHKLEKLHGLARSKQSSLTTVDGHLPCDHPCYTQRMRRNCRSVPPQRTLMRSAVNGFGLTFPKRASALEHGGGGGGGGLSPAQQDPPAVAQLKRRVLQLSEALVAVQHDNEVLLSERTQRNVLRDRLLHRYLVERDTGIAQLHAMLQELLAKVSNPMRLLRTKQQPSLSMNPVVAAQNILRDASSRLAEQVQALSNDIMKKTGAALPANAAAASAASSFGGGAAGDGNNNNSINMNSNNNNNNGGGGGCDMNNNNNNAVNAERDDPTLARRRELATRIQSMAESLPLTKRKAFLHMMVELRALFTSLSNSNHALLATFEEERDVHHTGTVKLKMQVAVLKDQLRSMGVREEEIAAVDAMTASGGGYVG